MTKNKLISMLLTVAVAAVSTVSTISCSDDDDDIDYLAFELRFGETTTIKFNNERHTLRLYDVVDNVTQPSESIDWTKTDISTMDYKTYAYIVCDETDSIVIAGDGGGSDYSEITNEQGKIDWNNISTRLEWRLKNMYRIDFSAYQMTYYEPLQGKFEMLYTYPKFRPTSHKNEYKFIFVIWK